MNTALIQVLGAVAYGELKAYDGAKAEAAAATDEATRKRFRKVAAEELRHHKGFVARLEALGADPDRAMAPYRTALDTYHGRTPSDDLVEEAVYGYLGEGIADDLLTWLREVVDPDTAAFIDTVIADEIEHEANAAADLRAVLADAGARRRANRAAQKMVVHMLASGRRGATPMTAFLRLGNPAGLARAIAGGHLRRMRAVGLTPLGLPVPAPLLRAVA
ncbi:MAG: ferritin-like domain-containing protein [Actinomycetota bacterium]|jgi:DNA-binding ferritin-like protein (Dps family)|nr:ferritin-like domain-containing protein [Actinomycetota bacterium]